MIALYMCIIMVFCMENENSTQLYHQKYCDSRHIEATNVISAEIDPGCILHYIDLQYRIYNISINHKCVYYIMYIDICRERLQRRFVRYVYCPG